MNKDRTGASELNETPSVSNIYCTSACCATGTRDRQADKRREQLPRRRRLINREITTFKVPYSVKKFENTKA